MSDLNSSTTPPSPPGKILKVGRFLIKGIGKSKKVDHVADVGKVNKGAGDALQNIKSLDDFLNDPSKLKGIKPDELYKYLEDNGYNPIPLNKSEKYKGIPFEEGGGFRVNWGGDRILQYHPGSRHHGDVPYYKISSGRTGTKRYDMNGNPID